MKFKKIKIFFRKIMGKVYSAALDRTLLPSSLFFIVLLPLFFLAYFALHPSSKRISLSLLFYCENPKRKAPSDLTEGAD
jgi:hypothetical protein